MKKSLNKLLAALLVLLIAAPSAPGETIPEEIRMSRGFAIAMAIRKNIDLRMEGRYTTLAEDDLTRSKAMYEPMFSSSVSGGMSRGSGDPGFTGRNASFSMSLTQLLPTGGSISVSPQATYSGTEYPGSRPTNNWQSSTGISLSQPLLRNAGRETTEINITMAATSLQDTMERFRSVTTDTVFSVITSYNHLYYLRQILEARKAALNSAENLLTHIREKRQGEQQPLEVANAEYAIVQRRKDLVEAERSVRDSEAHFRYLIGMETDFRIVPTDPPSREEPQETEEQAIKAAQELRSDLKQLRSNLKIDELQERIARRQTLPDLSLNVSGGVSGAGDNFGNSVGKVGSSPSAYWSAGLQFSVPIGNTAANIDHRKSTIRIQQVQDQIKSLEWKIQNDVESDMRALISARLQMQMADRSLKFAEQRLTEYKKNAETGKSTIQDVLNAESDLVGARNGQLDAVESFANAVARLWKDTGVLLDRFGVKVASSPRPGVTASSAPLVSGPPITSESSSPVHREGSTLATNAGGTSSSAAPGGATASESGRKGAVPTEHPAGIEHPASDGFTLKIGPIVGTTALDQAEKALEAEGLEPVVKAGAKRKQVTTRLFIGEFNDHEKARKECARLQGAHAEGFIVMGGKHTYRVFAGSYLDADKAAKEQKRLLALGISASLKKFSISVPTFTLSAGRFPDRQQATLEASRWEKTLSQKVGILPT